jgi:hypothetical protein
MSSERTITEIVLFELPSIQLAERLLAHASSERLSWLQDREDAYIVGVLLEPDPLDLALLLRSVQSWLERMQLAAIRFEVDRRVYALEAMQPALAAG